MTPNCRNAQEVLDQEFLTVRAKLLEVAAALDRIERGEGSVGDDSRMSQLRNALGLLATAESDFAEQFQMVFSRAYDPEWREDLDVGES